MTDLPDDIFTTYSYAPIKKFQITFDVRWSKSSYALIIRHYSETGMHWNSTYYEFPSKEEAENAELIVRLAT
jgi:hypothetical protein